MARSQQYGAESGRRDRVNGLPCPCRRAWPTIPHLCGTSGLDVSAMCSWPSAFHCSDPKIKWISEGCNFHKEAHSSQRHFQDKWRSCRLSTSKESDHATIGCPYGERVRQPDIWGEAQVGRRQL